MIAKQNIQVQRQNTMENEVLGGNKGRGSSYPICELSRSICQDNIGSRILVLIRSSRWVRTQKCGSRWITAVLPSPFYFQDQVCTVRSAVRARDPWWTKSCLSHGQSPNLPWISRDSTMWSAWFHPLPYTAKRVHAPKTRDRRIQPLSSLLPVRFFSAKQEVQTCTLIS